MQLQTVLAAPTVSATTITPPISPRQVAVRPKRFQCPEPGCRKAFKLAGGLERHRIKEHSARALALFNAQRAPVQAGSSVVHSHTQPSLIAIAPVLSSGSSPPALTTLHTSSISQNNILSTLYLTRAPANSLGSTAHSPSHAVRLAPGSFAPIPSALSGQDGGSLLHTQSASAALGGRRTSIGPSITTSSQRKLGFDSMPMLRQADDRTHLPRSYQTLFGASPMSEALLLATCSACKLPVLCSHLAEHLANCSLARREAHPSTVPLSESTTAAEATQATCPARLGGPAAKPSRATGKAPPTVAPLPKAARLSAQHEKELSDQHAHTRVGSMPRQAELQGIYGLGWRF